MSTNSCVIVKIKREDVGKSIKFDKAQLPDGVEIKPWTFADPMTGKVWNDESDKEKSEEIVIAGQYVGIYCHWDGYESGVGAALKEKFSDYDKALNLVAGGWCSSIDTDHIKHYANRKGEEWKNIKPIFAETVEEILKELGQEYDYLLDEDGWKCYTDETKEFEKY